MNARIIRFRRPFRERVEIEHRQTEVPGRWVFDLQHIGPKGRREAGLYTDVEKAFDAAKRWRRMGVRPVCVERRGERV